MPVMQEIAELVEDARDGDDAAFEELVRRHQNLVLGYAFNRLGDFHRAQDVVQDAFVLAHTKLGSLNDPAAFPAWLRGIALNCCRRSLRKYRGDWVSLDQYLELETEDENQLAQVERLEETELVHQAIANLPADLRDVTTLYYLEERSQKEVADFLGLSVTKVNNDLHASRQHMEGSLSIMVKKEIGKERLGDTFAAQLGEIIRVEGPFVEAEVKGGDMPGLLELLGTDGKDGGGEVLVIQRLGQGKYRGLKTSGDVGAGDKLSLRADPYTAVRSVSEEMTRDVVERQKGKRGTRLLETGIKVIDLMTPLVDGATLGIIGGAGVGRGVLLEELIERRNRIAGDLKTFFFLNGWDANGMQATPEEMERATDVHSNLENTFLLHNRGSDPVYAMEADYMDVRLYFSPIKATRGYWPAIDPLHSASAFLDPSVIEKRHYDLATAVRESLQQAHDLMADARYYELMALGARSEAVQYMDGVREDRLKELDDAGRQTVARAERIDAFFTQPFIISEAFTKMPGQTVSLASTLDGVEAILRGDLDDTDVSSLMWKGAI